MKTKIKTHMQAGPPSGSPCDSSSATVGCESWRVFQVNDCDWWLARSVDEAKQNAAEYYDCRPDDEDMISEAAELTDEELDRLQYYPDGNRNGCHHSFREELEARIASNPKVGMFATTEF